MKPIASLECEDCGKFLIADEEQICIFTLDDDECYAISRCPYCDRVIYDSCPANLISSLLDFGVKVFSWRTGEELTKEIVNG